MQRQTVGAAPPQATRRIALLALGSGLLATSAARALAAPASAAPTLAGPATVSARPGPPAAHDHFPFGPLGVPRRIGAFQVLDTSGSAGGLNNLLRGKTTALQLMFAGCKASCPIQGAVFAQAQRLAQQAQMPVQFLSLSVDALGDTPVRLQAWLRQFDARAGWLAAVPARVADVDTITALLGAGGQGMLSSADAHNGQVHLINRRAEMVERTPMAPPAADIVSALFRVRQRFG